jgi:hypothetical protein
MPAAKLTCKASEMISIKGKLTRTNRTLANFYGMSGKNYDQS